MAYNPGDKIFAKVKGHPHWPSRINRLPPDVSIPKGKYPIFFYGTHEVYFLAPKDIFPYEKFKHKFAIQKNKPLFQAGLIEIEENPDVLLYGKDPQSEAFLARFYKFAPSDASSLPPPPPTPLPPPQQPQQQQPNPPSQTEQPQINQQQQKQTAPSQAGKRTSTSSLSAEHSQPAKRPHIEVAPPQSTATTKKVATPRSSAKKKGTSVKVDPSPTNKRTPTQKTPTRKTPAKPATDPTPPPPPLPQPKPADLQPPSTTEIQSTVATETQPSARPKRLAALRLRIRKDEHGLTYSPAHDSSLSSLSPSTPGSTETAEAQQPVKETTPPPTVTSDPLRITIKQLSTSPSIVTNNNVSTTTNLALPTKPIFSVTQTPTSLMGVGTNVTANSAQKKSTAVVTPLRREQMPLVSELSDGSAAVSTPSTDGETTPEPRTPKRDRERSQRRATRVSRPHHSTSERKERRRHGPDVLKLSESVTATTTTTATKAPTTTTTSTTTTTPMSEHDSSSTQSPWPSSEYGKSHAESATNRSAGSAVSSPKLASQKHSDFETATTATVAHVDLDNDSTGARKEQKEQQLKDLDTEARLLLIDRSIKSSLVRDHEDIATCVDRLAVLDRMTISLPILAKCWTVVETIRKCRRYKRSLEVKIAAQKVFNKFLQLYATADKYELDLAHTELVRHQQRYTRQQALQRASPGQPNVTNDAEVVIPPYAGPKSMAELFQVSSGTLSERRPASTAAPPTRLISSGGSLESSGKSSTVGSDSGAAKLRESTDSVTPSDGPFQPKPVVDAFPTSFSLSDIPLPEESTSYIPHRPSLPAPSDIQPAGENGEEEFEVLDEYEETGEVKTTVNAATSVPPQIYASSSTGIIMTGAADYVPVPLVPYNMVQPSFLPAANFCGVPVDASGAASVGATSVSGFVTPAGQMPPPYPAPYAISYGYGCLPSSSFTQVMPTSSLPIPYTPIVANTVSSSGPVSASSFSYPALPVEATPPQSTSKAYVPHALHPSTDPPPSYRPFVSTQYNKDPQKSDPSPVRSPKVSRESRTDNTLSRHLGSSSGRLSIPSSSSPVRRSSSSRHDSDRHSRSGRQAPPNRQFRSPPHRARSPHALPHPLEHYQRCLVSALSSDEERSGEVSESGPNAPWSNEVGTKHTSSTRVNTDDLLSRSRDSEDLDTRIARLIGTASRTHSQPKSTSYQSDGRKSGNPFGSPPPPPPPPPTSQRILFTHRPLINSSGTSRTSLSGPSRSTNHHSSTHGPGPKDHHHSSSATRRSIPPHTPDSPPARRSTDVDQRLTAFNSAPAESQLTGSYRKPAGSHHPVDCDPPVSHPPSRVPNSDHEDSRSEPSHSSVVSRNPAPSGLETVTTSAASTHDTSSRSRLNRDEDRELYSMLGV